MKIEKVIIENLKCFKGRFQMDFNDGLNIIVGDNESGKSTVIEAIHLVLTGILNGKYIKNELNQFIFNNKVSNEYLSKLSTSSPIGPPEILIEAYISDDACPTLIGDGNGRC